MDTPQTHFLNLSIQEIVRLRTAAIQKSSSRAPHSPRKQGTQQHKKQTENKDSKDKPKTEGAEGEAEEDPQNLAEAEAEIAVSENNTHTRMHT